MFLSFFNETTRPRGIILLKKAALFRNITYIYYF